MSSDISNEFDPFRVLVSFASEANDADVFAKTFTGVGLKFDLGLTAREEFSHSTRIRALRPRVLAAYDSLSASGRLVAANAGLRLFMSRTGQSCDGLHEALAAVGWGIQGDQLVALDPHIREMFFPRGSQWDAFVVIRGFVEKVTSDLLVVDPYCDQALFGVLESSGVRKMTVRLLCRQKPGALKAEAEAFSKQYPELRFELRKSSDFHDRFLVIDESDCVHIGASINHAGSRAFMISAVEDERNREVLLDAIAGAWDDGTPV